MNKKRVFDKNLYREAFRQGKLIGLTALVLLTLEAVLIPVGNVISQMNYAREMAQMGQEYIVRPQVVGMFSLHPLLAVTFSVATPLLLLYLFNFLTKRNASDYYHSIPQTRSCVFLSFFAAAMTWAALYVLVPSLLGAGLSAVFSSYFTVNWNNVWHVLFNILAGNLFVAASIAIAVCLTGTTFTNIVVSVIVIFIPRIFLTVITSVVASQLPMIPGGSLLPILDAKYNVVVGIFTGFFLGEGGSLTEFSSGIYTWILGGLYMLIGLWLYNRRKSEAAGQAAASRKLQLVYRLIIAMIICLIPCSVLFETAIGHYEMNMSEIYLVFVLYLVAVIAYFLYELITTRKWSNLAKAIPGLGILAVLNTVVVFGMCGIYTVTLNVAPDPEEIRSVSVLELDEPTYYNGQQYEDYFAAKTEQIRLDSEEVRELVSERLQEEVALWKEGDNRYYGMTMEGRRLLTMAIRTKSGTHYRYIYLEENDWGAITKALEEQEGFREAYMELPALGENSTVVQVSGLGMEASEEVYRTLRDEVAGMEFGDWYPIAENSNLYGDGVLGILTLVSTIGTQTYASAIPITGELPKTAMAYAEQVNKDEEESREKILSFLADPEQMPYSEMNLNVYLYGSDLPLSQLCYYDYGYEEEEKAADMNPGISWKDLNEVLQKHAKEAVDPHGLYGKFELSLEFYEEGRYGYGENYTYFFNLNGLEFEGME
jgi:ABC-2 type transport system permease protein